MKTTALDRRPQFRPLSTENHLQRVDRGKESFGENLLQAIDSVDRLQKEADSDIQALATGEKRDLHQTMISMEKAGISFQLMMHDQITPSYILQT